MGFLLFLWPWVEFFSEKWKICETKCYRGFCLNLDPEFIPRVLRMPGHSAHSQAQATFSVQVSGTSTPCGRWTQSTGRGARNGASLSQRPAPPRVVEATGMPRCLWADHSAVVVEGSPIGIGGAPSLSHKGCPRGVEDGHGDRIPWQFRRRVRPCSLLVILHVRVSVATSAFAKGVGISIPVRRRPGCL